MYRKEECSYSDESGLECNVVSLG